MRIYIRKFKTNTHYYTTTNTTMQHPNGNAKMDSSDDELANLTQNIPTDFIGHTPSPQVKIVRLLKCINYIIPSGKNC